MGYKAGMTHVLRDVDRPGSRIHKKEAVEAVTIIETPPMMVVGLVGYVETPKGLRAFSTVFANHLNAEFRRRLYKNFHKVEGEGKAFSKNLKKAETEEGKAAKEDSFKNIAKNCQVVRVIAHTQISKLNLRQKKAHVVEIQVRT